MFFSVLTRLTTNKPLFVDCLIIYVCSNSLPSARQSTRRRQQLDNHHSKPLNRNLSNNVINGDVLVLDGAQLTYAFSFSLVQNILQWTSHLRSHEGRPIPWQLNEAMHLQDGFLSSAASCPLLSHSRLFNCLHCSKRKSSSTLSHHVSYPAAIC